MQGLPGGAVFLSRASGQTALHPNFYPAVAVRGNVLETAVGRLVVSVYTADDPNVSHLFASEDGGRSWSYRVGIAMD